MHRCLQLLVAAIRSVDRIRRLIREWSQTPPPSSPSLVTHLYRTLRSNEFDELTLEDVAIGIWSLVTFIACVRVAVAPHSHKLYLIYPRAGRRARAADRDLNVWFPPAPFSGPLRPSPCK